MGLQSILGPLVAWYLFLTGVGAGAYWVGVTASLLGERFRLLVKPGVFLGAPLVAAGTTLYLLSLGIPLQALFVLLSVRTAALSIALQLLTAFTCLGLVHLILLLIPRMKVDARALQVLGVLNGLLAVGAILASGLVLSAVQAVPFWNTPLIPFLFLVSALLSGMGAVLAVVDFWRWVTPASVDAIKEPVAQSVYALCRLNQPLILIEIVALGALFSIMLGAGSRAAELARFLLLGEFRSSFWWGVVFLGLVTPMAVEVWYLPRSKTMSLAQWLDWGLIVGTCLLVGGIVLRYAILAAGAGVAGS